MSAYIVDRAVVDALVSLVFDGPLTDRPVSPDTAWNLPAYLETLDRDAIGALLIAENVRSVRFRYPDCGDDLPGPVERYYLEPYTYARPVRRPSTVEGLKLCDGWEYQACEGPDYRDTKAGELLGRLREALIRTLPGYDAAPWADWPPELPAIEVIERDADGFAAIIRGRFDL